MKEVHYAGNTFETDDRVRYVVTDADGDIWGYEFRPEIGKNFPNEWLEPETVDGVMHLFSWGNGPCENWKESLVEV